MTENPTAQVKYPKENNERVRRLSEEEEKRLFEALPKHYHAMVIALNSGLRRSEQLNLKWTDIDFRLGQITIKEGRNERSKIIPMRETLERIPR